MEDISLVSLKEAKYKQQNSEDFSLVYKKNELDFRNETLLFNYYKGSKKKIFSTSNKNLKAKTKNQESKLKQEKKLWVVKQDPKIISGRSKISNKSNAVEETDVEEERYFTELFQPFCSICRKKGHKNNECRRFINCGSCLGSHLKKNCKKSFACYCCGALNHSAKECAFNKKKKCRICNRTHGKTPCSFLFFNSLSTKEVEKSSKNLTCYACFSEGHIYCSKLNSSETLFGKEFRTNLKKDVIEFKYSLSTEKLNKTKNLFLIGIDEIKGQNGERVNILEPQNLSTVKQLVYKSDHPANSVQESYYLITSNKKSSMKAFDNDQKRVISTATETKVNVDLPKQKQSTITSSEKVSSQVERINRGKKKKNVSYTYYRKDKTNVTP